jgi:hypothetical protein
MMNGNKMYQVAAMFGKQLGEEFDVRFNGKLKCLMFDEQRGLLYFNGDEWRKNYACQTPNLYEFEWREC